MPPEMAAILKAHALVLADVRGQAASPPPAPKTFTAPPSPGPLLTPPLRGLIELDLNLGRRQSGPPKEAYRRIKGNPLLSEVPPTHTSPPSLSRKHKV